MAAPSAKEKYQKGYVYNVNGVEQVWDGTGWTSEDNYLAQRGKDKATIMDGIELMRSIDRAKAKIKNNDPGFLGMGSNTGFWGGLGSGDKGNSQGLMHWGGWPGSPGRDLDRSLQDIRSNQFIKGMRVVKNQSPTGGSGGSVSDADALRFESVDGALYPDMSKEDLLYNLDRVARANGSRTPGISQDNPIDISKYPVDQIPDGAYFRAHDGRVYRQQKGSGWPTTVDLGNGTSAVVRAKGR